ncbi:MAG TPA: Ni/Fe-hydrogenase cytochrome b subunit, partial [Planctomycetaceae bacterium]|nr:Ni/Fe-hydrogenase cytochrome b subunit [Planctomycetaceae bacterium]
MMMADRLSSLKTVLWAFVGILGAVTVVRFLYGLGAVTNLSDFAPWGLWIAFDVMAGVALAAGGFVLAAAVYIFGLEEYRPFVRPAILTALLGYAAVAAGLVYDLGIPWHIWHPLVFWQYHSVLFEVAMCVMFYLTVLALEFAPVVLEHPWFSHPLLQRIHSGLKRMTVPLVIAGIVLSTLHQSSLGSLFLITPYRLHPLWYSPIIYVLFFVSAVALGLMTVVLESLLAAFFLKHHLHLRPLSGLGLTAAAVLVLYVVLRLGDLALRGTLWSHLGGSWQSLLFVFELATSAVIPACLLLIRRVRASAAGLGLCAGLVVFGMVLNRIDVCLVAFARPETLGYFPSWMEVAVSLGIVAGGVLVFIFFVERFRVYEDVVVVRPEREPSFDPAAVDNLMPRPLAAPRRYSLVAVGAAAAAVLFLPAGGPEPRPVPV